MVARRGPDGEVITDPEAPSPMAFAGQVIHPGPPALRERYPDGVQITPYGVPDWIPYARLLGELPPPPQGLGWDEARVLGVQTANALGRRSGDPLWGADEAHTPTGWTWARLPLTRQIALVPIELYGAFRHVGGVSTSGNDRRRRGVSGTEGVQPRCRIEGELTEDVVLAIEDEIGRPLPGAYREFLVATNGGRASVPAVHPKAGFVVDQPLFGSAPAGGDPFTDLVQQHLMQRDRIEAGLLPIGFVQGGLLVLGLEYGTVSYLDDDDPADQQGYGPDAITRNLLQWLEPSFAAFWSALRAVPASLQETAERHAAEGWARILPHPQLGRSLPADRRA
ncbi:HNH endonuclease [Dactylosporangium vinaceum]|uniref:HNH endonuclease n=1 Tax=Dactylosporangium vinaceum TaxID=53362 RepID=A0ABV5MJW4_9ACTN|nr:HNH endonuclease [Dactylosporangium vinaceum]UAB92726.1 HNH endonuclease [Dactylosporangium vinaceum]